MAEFPFPITIEPASSSSPPQTIICTGLLRDLGGKRKVFDAIWEQRPVIVKVFADPIKAKYHMKREWRGLKLLQQRNLNSPTPLFYNKTKQYGWAVVTEKIDDALTAREEWDNTTDAAKKRELLCRVSRELAKQHSKGVLQKDLHLGNFMLQEERLFALDPSEMRFFSGEVNKKQAIAQLALLTAIVPDEDTDTIASVCEDYAQVRSWKFSRSDMAVFSKELARCRKNGIKKALRKCLRTNKRHQEIKKRSYRGVAARDFFEEADFCEFLEDIDELMQRGQILKDGNTCFVSHISLAGKEVVVKRYNHKGIIHSVRHTIKKSRARRGWLHAHRLRMLNIATPRPLAYIESCKRIIVWKSYLITEYVRGQKLYDFMRDGKTDKDQRSKVTEQVKEVLERLGKYRITHGDLKHTNILITEKGPVLTDLDGMKVHEYEWLYRIRRAKDTAHLRAMNKA
ncbi:MAG: lipopolysaccharide kinase InaA family protein [Planctomycetota bacterium]|jgi:tRNA A-37 threonylcarbamoyl transferase component Bud32